MTNDALQSLQALSSNDPFEALFLSAPVMLHSVGKHGRFLRVSQFWADKLGHDVSDMVDQPILDFLTDESRAYAEEITIPEFRKTGNANAIEYDFVRKDGQILPVVTSAIAQYGDDGEFFRSFAVSFDNSKAKHISQELQLKSSMDAIGQLVGGVAHDFNNLLAVVQGNLDFLRQDPDDPDREELIKDAVAATKRGGSLIEQLLTYGRRGKPSPGLVDVNQVVGTANRLIHRLFPSNIEILTLLEENLWNTPADPALLETAILNLLNNARDALPAGGRITVRTSNAHIDGGFIEPCDGIEPGHFVMISVSDTGQGMDQSVLSNVFEPFFTTKSQRRGSGLGLPMVMGFIRQSKGAIRVESEPGVGTTFRMYLPVEHAHTNQTISVDVARQTLDREKKILIVEDDSSVRRVLARQLKDDKIKVFEAETGDGAFQAMDDGLRPDLLLTDVVMPGSLQGPDLVQKARAMLPDLRVLFISGYPADTTEYAKNIAPTDPQLTKPVSQDKLLAAVTELLVEE